MLPKKNPPRLRVAARGEGTAPADSIITPCWHCGAPFPVGDGRRWRMWLRGWPGPAFLLICRPCMLLLLNSEPIRRRFAADMAALPGRPSSAGWYLVPHPRRRAEPWR